MGVEGRAALGLAVGPGSTAAFPGGPRPVADAGDDGALSALEPAARLNAYLAAGARRPFVWGECDCCLWVAGWIELARGIDPAAAIRGRYGTQAGAARLIARAGGLRALAGRLAASAGLSEVEAPRPGDVALVEHASAGPALAIRTPRGFAVKAPRGVCLHPLPVLVAWSV